MTMIDKVYAVDIKQVFTPAQTFGTFGDLTNVIVRNAFVLAGLISFLLLIFGGVGIIAGAGSSDPKQIEKGKEALTGGIIGLLVIVASVWLVQIIEKITGIHLLN